MLDMEQLAAFLGWCVVINIALLSVTAVIILLFKEPIVSLHGRLFQIDRAELERLYFNWLGHYKLINIIFFLVPYIALKIIT